MLKRDILKKHNLRKRLFHSDHFVITYQNTIDFVNISFSPFSIKQHEESLNKRGNEAPVGEGAQPAFLLDRQNATRAKVLSQMIKQKRKEKAGKWNVPLPKVRPISEDEIFKVIRSGKRKKKQWKRMITKVTFVPEDFTRKPPKFERFIRPTGLRFKKAHITQ